MLIETDIKLTVEIGILTIFTLFFSFAGIKSTLRNEYDKIKTRVEEIRAEDKDIINSKMDKKNKSVMNLLKMTGRTFRLCIYVGIAALTLTFVNIKFNSWVIDLFFLLILFVQIWGLILNVHRFKDFYELDYQEQIEVDLKMIHLLKDAIKKGEYEEKLPKILKKKNLFVCLLDDFLSLLNQGR